MLDLGTLERRPVTLKAKVGGAANVRLPVLLGRRAEERVRLAAHRLTGAPSPEQELRLPDLHPKIASRLTQLN